MSAILGLIEPLIAPFDPPTLKTLPHAEPNIKWIGLPVAEIWPFKIWHITRGALGTPYFGGGEVVRVIDRKSDGGFL